MFTDSIGYQPDLIAHWKFNANDGDILYDHSGNANHGSINGPEWDEGFVAPPTAVTFAVNMREYEGLTLWNGELYDGIMVSEGLDNEEIADVMNYILNSWVNSYNNEIITPSLVNEIKK